jgi:hypothetical protein
MSFFFYKIREQESRIGAAWRKDWYLRKGGRRWTNNEGG